MPSRDLKEEREQPVEKEEMTSSLSPIQLQLSPEMQKTLVQIVLEDYHSAEEARKKRDYGKDSKGSTMDFDKWLKGLRAIYTSEREPKDTPWKFCSNRSFSV